jgi:glycosyltransferase involved in cell wall biosynthesis
MRVALVHDWLTGMRGGEKCLEAFCELFPQADLYTLIYLPQRVSPAIRSLKVHPSWLNRLPKVQDYYRYCLPLFPTAIERFDLENYDLVLSSSHCVAKGAFPHRSLHISYIHAPMRYVWDMYHAYFGPDSAWLARAGMFFWRRYLQAWDRRSSERVDFFLANSRNVADKIKALYGREATVIHPPVDFERFYVAREQSPYYLLVSALVPYKRIDLAVAAFNGLKLPLKIVGDGPLRKKLETMAGPKIEFLGWIDHGALPSLYASCQAVIFPGEEDFGIVPVEAQASGRPVIAYGRGGVLDSVIPLSPADDAAAPPAKPTGIFFPELSAESLMEAVRFFQKTKHMFDPTSIRKQASRFSRDRFKAQILGYVETRLCQRLESR